MPDNDTNNGMNVSESRESKYNNKTRFTEKGMITNLGNGQNFDSSGAINQSAIDEIMESNFIQNSSNMDWLNKFARFSYVDPYNSFYETGREYLFFTKPDLHLFANKNTSDLNSEIKNNVFFLDEFDRYRHIMEQLQYSVNKSKPFMPILTNSVANSLELPSINSLESESNENIYGDKITYRHGSESGDVGFEFSIEFYETKMLELYHLFKMWDTYYELKTKGIVTPPDESYIINMELHDQISIYKIIVAEDMETILFYAKYFGVYPKNLPRDAFGSLDKGQLKLSIDFKAAFVVDNRPDIIQDFNQVSLLSAPKGTKFANIWDDANQRVNYKWVGVPYIVFDKDVSNGMNKTGSKGAYKLKWREA